MNEFTDENEQAFLDACGARAVKATLGPSGRNVVLAKNYGSPTITKDGVTVANHPGSQEARRQ